MKILRAYFLVGLVFGVCSIAIAAEGAGDGDKLQPMDAFELEYAADPRISPDGSQIVYVRTFMDVMSDRRRTNLWIVNWEGGTPRPLTSGSQNDSSPRWSPTGDRIVYASNAEGGQVQLYVRWMDSGQEARLTQLQRAPGDLSWSPDGKWIAFTQLVPTTPEKIAELPTPPAGATWTARPRVIQRLIFRADGQGYLEPGYRQLFVLSAEGGTPRQVISGPYNVATPSWTPDGKGLVFSSNRVKDWEYDPLNSEVYEVTFASGEITTLTARQGPDTNPQVSPDGKFIAYLGFDDRYQGYQVTDLYIMNRDGSRSRKVETGLDRDVVNPQWSGDSKGIYFQYDDEGNTKLAYVPVKGKVEVLTGNVGGLSIGRPYTQGQFSATPDGRIAYTLSTPKHPADVAVVAHGQGEARRLTALNDDLFAFKKLGAVEELWWNSSFDDRRIQGWVVKPPDFDPSKKYPLILEIHGGPFHNYGDRFSAEIQLYAAAGYVVLYANPRGSTSYGGEFGNLIHHNYPGEDYDDLMSGVDAVIEQGYVDADNLFVTGGSGGGVLSSWVVGKTDRFAAAVVAKPVINWYGFVLTADMTPFFYKYWFPGFPWDHTEHYMKRSPISQVGNVTTPTMLLTGEQDLRTPMPESEQFYHALKLRKVDTALVRIQESPHHIAARPSNMLNKVTYILAWFERYRTHGD